MVTRPFVLAPLVAAAVAFAVTAQVPGTDTSFPITPQAGPWLILVNSYEGETARKLAEDLIQEVRTNYRLPAYGFNRGAEERAKEHERVRKLKEQQQQFIAQSGLPADTKLRAPKTIHINDQYAVLIGGYKDIDTARKALDEIRKLKPPSERLMHKTMTGEARDDGNKNVQTKALNPFQTAFVVRNPSVAVDREARDNKPDANLKVYNADESYSLLKCPKGWTLVVKSYQGRSTLIQTQATEKSLVQKLTGSGGSDLLNANAKQAHEVASMLRKLGYEAYVLHTEYSSVVTIGAFDAAGDPKLLQLQKVFINAMANPTGGVGQMHVIGGVQFLAQPMPMPVPKF